MLHRKIARASEPPERLSSAGLASSTSDTLLGAKGLLETGSDEAIMRGVSYEPRGTPLHERLTEIDDPILDGLPVGVYVCDRDGAILRYNQRAVELWGVAFPELGTRGNASVGPTVFFVSTAARFRIRNVQWPTSFGRAFLLSTRRSSSNAPTARASSLWLAALTRAHELTRPGMILDRPGETRETTLHALIRTVFSPYTLFDLSTEPECVVIQGQDLSISGHSVTNLALLFHELATNAAKHGAVSSPQGLVYIDCVVENEELSLTWKERGGPSVNGQPSSTGFGGVLTRSVMNHFGARMHEEWQGEGLAVHITAPVERLKV